MFGEVSELSAPSPGSTVVVTPTEGIRILLGILFDTLCVSQEVKTSALNEFSTNEMNTEVFGTKQKKRILIPPATGAKSKFGEGVRRMHTSVSEHNRTLK